MSEEKKMPRFVGGPFDGQFFYSNCYPELGEALITGNHVYKRQEDGDLHFMLTKYPLRLPEPPGVTLTKRESPQHLGFFRISYELLANMIGLPVGTRILAVSDQVFFSCNQLAVRVEDSRLPVTQPASPMPELDAECFSGDVSVTIDWSKSIPGAESSVRPDANKLAALLSRIDEHLEILCGSWVSSAVRIDTLRLRGEIVAAIGELQGELQGQEQGGDSDVKDSEPERQQIWRDRPPLL